MVQIQMTALGRSGECTRPSSEGLEGPSEMQCQYLVVRKNADIPKVADNRPMTR